MSDGAGRSRVSGWISLVIMLGALVYAFGVLFWPRSESGPPKSAPQDSAKEHETFGVVAAFPVEGEVLERQLVLYFSENVVEPKTATGDSEPILTIEPSLDGVTKLGPNFVSFRIYGSVAWNAIYQVKLNPNLRSVLGKVLDPDRLIFAFPSTQFVPGQLWPVEDTPQKSVIGLMFPQSVDIEALRPLLNVKTPDGQAIPFILEAGADAQSFHIVLENHRAWPVTVTVLKGLRDASARLELMQDVALTYPTNMQLAVTGNRWTEFSKERQELVIAFSRDVLSDDLRSRFTITNTDTGQTVPFELKEQQMAMEQSIVMTQPVESGSTTHYQIAIAKGLPAAQHAELSEDYSAEVTGFMTTGVGPTPGADVLTLDYKWWGSEGRDGLVYHVSFTQPVGAIELKSHLEITPPVPNLRVQPKGYNGIAIYGDFESKREYRFKVLPGMKYGTGSTLAQGLDFTDVSEDAPKHLGFGQEGKFYFPRRPGLSLSLESRNLSAAELSLHRLFPSNIAVALSEMAEGTGSRWFVDAWAEDISKQTLTLPMKPDQLVTTTLELDSVFPPDKKGVFCLRASTKERWEDGTKIVLWTDLGLMAHWVDDELALFAHNLYSLAPMAQAKVTVYSSKNQVLGEMQTNEQGIARFTHLEKSLGVPRVVVVEQGDDYTFLELKPREDESTPIDPAMPAYGRDEYDAFVYADRELYRPGETAHVRWLVRTNYGDALPSVPLLVKVIKPTGNVLLTQTTELSVFGGGGMDLSTHKAYPTGKYEVRLLVPGTEEPIGSYTFSLEEFVPNKIKSTVTLAENRWVAGQPYSIKVNAQHLFGAPAVDRKVEAKIVFSKQAFSTEKWKEYRFANDSDFLPDAYVCGESRTDAEGNTAFEFTYEAPPKLTFPVKALAVGRVFELGGRAVLGRAEASLFPSSTALGIAAAPGPLGKGVEVHVAAIQPDESPAALQMVSVSLEKQTWNYYVRRYYSDYEPRWSESFEPFETKEVALVDGKGAINLDVSGYGYYRVRVHSDQTAQFSTVSFYCCDGVCSIVDSARPSLIKVALDKDSYTSGDQAQLRIESPFDGQGIVVLQGDHIYDMIPIAIANGVGVASVNLTADYFPNVWVEATVVHAIKEGKTQVYPFSSTALTNIRVTNPQRSLHIAFSDLPQEIRPQTELTVSLDVKDAAGTPAETELTLAAVDEGIHSITDYKSPQPYEWLLRSRKPDYRRAHYYDKVAYDFEKPAIGGDIDLAQRLGAAEESWIKPLALWSGVVQSDANGHATATFQVPEFTGQIRMVAVGAGASALGSQSANIYVRRPYMMRIGLPRFLLPGDAFHSRVVLFNQSAESCTAKVSWSSTGALQAGGGSKELPIEAGKEASFLVALAAREAIGSGNIRWEVVVLNPASAEVERIVEEMPLPVHSPAAYQSHHEVVVLNPGEGRDFRNTVFLDDDRTSVKISVSANPLLRLEKALQYVVGYPHGCIEQTTSRLMPTYLLRQSRNLTGVTLKGQDLSFYVSSGISRLFAMQTATGGLGYWPGALEPTPYGSVYALHFLTLVKRDKEFGIPAEAFAALQEYVRNLAFNTSQNSASELYTRAYALYVLALDGDLKAIQQIDRFSEIPMPKTARYLLAGALALSTGDADRVSKYLKMAPAFPYDVSDPDETYASTIRNTAVELLMLERMQGDKQDIAAKANELLAFLDTRFYGNTHESSFVVSALSTYLGDIAANVAQSGATIVGPEGQATVAGAEVYSNEKRGSGSVYTVTNTGQTPLFINLTVEGVPEKPDTKPVSEGIRLRRSLHTQDGAAYEQTTFRQADSFVVKLTTSNERELRDVVISDLIPAGFEIENPRLDPDAFAGNTFSNPETPSYLEIRDDRLVIAFNTLPRGDHNFYYIVRAVTPGVFTQPQCVAECMYDATVKATTESRSIEVQE